MVVAAATCSDLTAPEGLKGTVTITYAGPPDATGGTIQVIVGQKLSPTFQVSLSGIPQTRSRYTLSLPNAQDANVLRVFGTGNDSVEVVGRGNATLVATLMVAGVGVDTSVRASINVVATPASNTVDSTSLGFAALTAVKQLKGSSLKSDGSSMALNASSLSWSSADPSIADVSKLTDSTASVTAIANGTTTITATFDGVDKVTVPVTVAQRFTRFRLSSAALASGEIAFSSLDATATVSATPMDSLGRDLGAGSQVAPQANFISTSPGTVGANATSGLITALSNTTPGTPARIYAAVASGPTAESKSDSIPVRVKQIATSLTIDGPRTETITAIGATRSFTAEAKDANNRSLGPGSIAWSSLDPTTAEVNSSVSPVVVTALKVGATRIAATRVEDQLGDTISLVVTNDPASVELLPPSLTILSLEDTVAFASATVRNSKGDALTGADAAVTFISKDPAIALVLPDGRIVGKAIGATSVIATAANGVADTAAVTVANAPASIAVTPSGPQTLTAFGATLSYSGVVSNALGTTIPGAQITWSVPSGSSFVSIDAVSGLVTALANGTATIRATSGSAFADATVVVAQEFSATTSSVTAVPANIPANGTSQTTATVQLKDANGNNLAFGGAAVQVTTSLGSPATQAAVDRGSGRYTATITSTTSAGTATIGASVGGTPLASTTQVVVTAGVRYAVTSNVASVTLPGPVLISAQLVDVNDNPVAIPGQTILWTVEGPGGNFATPTSLTNVNGLAQISYTPTVAGVHAVTATDNVSRSGVSANIAVNNPAPTLGSLGTTTGDRLQTLNVVFTGTGFFNNVTSVNVGTGITVNSTTVNSSTQLTANITITGAAALGPRTFTVTNPAPGGGTSGTQTFTVANNPAPTLTARTPTSGNRLQTLDVTLTGTGFIQGVSTVTFSGTGIAVNAVTVNSPTQLVANITISSTAATGARTIRVTNAAPGGGQSATQSFTVNNPPATLTSLSATSANRLQTLDVVFTGTGFIAGASTVNVGADITVNTTTVNSATQITANISVGAAAVTGTRNFSVTNPAPGGGTSATQAFAISNPSPTLTALGTTTANRLQTLDVVFTGSGFISGVTTVDVPTGVTVNSTTVNSGTQITANLTITAVAPTGAQAVSVTNAVPGGGTSATQTLTINNPPAILVSLGTTTASRLQTLDVVFTGTGFIDGVSSVIVPAGVTVNSTTVNSATQLTANLGITTAAPTGVQTFSVTNALPGGGASGTVPFTITNPLPTLVGIAPTSANRLQQLDVVFTGTGFIAGVTALNLGAGITVNTTTVNSSTQITANITVTGAATLGARSFSLSNPVPGGGTTAPQTFTVNNPSQTLTGISPTSGNRLQQLNVVFTGTGFIAGVSSVDVGPGITVNTTTVDNANQITANLTITAAAATGQRNFTVTNTPGGTSAPQAFTVNNPAPTLTSLGTTTGNRLQTLDVVFNGSGFISGLTTVNVGGDITVNSITVTTPNQLTASISIGPAATFGARSFSVTNAAPGGGTSATQTFTVANNPTPTLTTLAPTSANRLQTLNVVFTGSGFIQGVSTVNVGADIAVNSVTVNSSAQLTANITIGSAAALGARTFSVTNAAPGGGTSTAQTFTVNNPTQSLTGIAPSSGNRLQTLDVLFTGTGFIAGVSSVDVGPGITVNTTNVTGATSITANITIGPTAPTGDRNFTVTNTPGGTSAPQTFTVSNPAPTLTALGATSAVRLQTLDVVFTGTGFIQGVSAVNVGAGITVNTTTVNNATQLTANLTITAAAAAGARTFSVTNALPGGGTTATQPFTVNNPAPALTSLGTTSANRLQTLDVVFNGGGFIQGTTTVNVGADITVNSVTVTNATQLTANLTIGAAATLGPRSFTVSNAAPGGGTTAAQTFTVNNPAQTLTGIAPVSGTRLQTLDVVFTGTGFVTGASSVDVGPGITVNSATVNSATQITANLTITETAATGPRSFTVTNTPGGTSAPQTFTVSNPAPTLASVTPGTGDRLQTLNVVFTGTNFVTGVSTVNVGAGITVNTVTVDSPTQLTANITITGAAAFGPRNFTVTNAAPGGGITATRTFTVVNNPVPTLTDVAPAEGTRLQTLNVMLTGSGFIQGVSTANTGSGITVNSTTVDSPTQITANVSIAATAVIGVRSFSVTNASPGGGTSGSDVFTVTGNPVPTLTSLGTTSANRLETLNVVFNGTGFISGVSSVNVPAGITVNTTTVNSATQLTANLTITAAAATGAQTFSVTNAAPGGGSSATQAFTVNNPVPTLASLGTTAGNRLQTLNVVFTGTNFLAGASAVSVGPDITVNSMTVNATQITASITIGAAAATGPRAFAVVNSAPGGGTSTTQAFTVTNPAPTLTALGTTSGNRLQTLDVVFTGTNFVAGASTVSVGADITVNSTTVTSATQLTANITIGPAATLGARPFSVVNAAPGGGTSATQSFTVNNPTQTLTGIAPTSGNRLQTLDVVFTGTGFVTGASTVDVGPGITVNTTTVNSSIQITANITITAAAATGPRNFTVTNTPGGTSLPQTFTVSNPTPTLTALGSTSGSRLQTLDVVFTGTNFIAGVSTVNVGADITVNSVTVNSATQLTANISIASVAVVGARTLSVTNAAPGGGTSATQSFTVTNPVPTLTARAPTGGNRLQTLDVTLTGTGFIAGASTVDVSGNGITVNSTTVNSPTEIVANLAIAATANTNQRNLSVTNAAPGGGTSAPQSFTVSNPAPTLISLAPASAARLQTLDVVFTGTGFIQGVSSVSVSGANITVNTTTVNSPTQLTANITIAANATTGARNVAVVNAAPGGGTSATQVFTVNNLAPTLSAIAPVNGSRLQTLNVVFTGTNFSEGVSSVDVGAGIAVNTTTVNSATQITANLTITAAAAAGARTFSVINAAPGGGASATQAFTVNNPAPSLTSLGTTSGNRLQTLDVVFNGTGFIQGATTVNVGADITVNSVTVTTANQLTANLTIGAAAALGARTFSVTNAAPGGGTSATQTFTINNPSQTLTGIAPTNGVKLQTLDVVFTGTGFITGASSVDVGPGITVNTTTVNSATQITANLTITATAAAGARNFTVTNTPGGTSAAQQFTVTNPAPTLTALGTTTGSRLQTLDVVFTGTGFIAGTSTVSVGGADITVNSTTVNSATQITANITLGVNAATGPRSFSVTNPTPGGGTSATQTFTVTNPAPTLTALGTTSANRLQTLNVVFTGTGFIANVSTVTVGTGITVNTTTVDSPTQITANLSITAAAATGVRTFSVTNAAPGGGSSATQSFTVNNPAAALTTIAPTNGNRLQTLDVVFTGSGFVSGTTTVSVGAGITVNTTTVDSPTQLTANITIGSGAALGARSFTVSNPAPGGGTSAAQTFTVNNPSQTLTGIAPTSGNRLQTLDIVFSGTGFVDGASTVDVGAGITVNTQTVNSATQITANLTITAAAATGARNFTVTNTPGGTSLPQTFTVNNPAPTLTALGTSSANRLQTLDVVFTGTGFIQGVSTVNVGADITVNSVTVNSPTQLTANLTISTATTTGARTFSVTNAAPGGGTTATQPFTINNPAPTLTALGTTTADRLQTLDVVFTGTGFITGVTTVSVGAGITVNSQTVNSATQITANLTITGAAALGARAFSVTNTAPGGGTSATQTFTVVNNPAPTLAALGTTAGSRLQTLDVVFTGTGFIAGVSTVSVGADITVNTTTVSSATQITANLTIGATASTGPRNFSVTNAAPGGGTSAVQSFTVNNPAPTLTALGTTSANRLQTLDVVLTGSGFITGVSTVNVGGVDITVNTTTVNSPTQITATITVAANATTGARNFSVTNAAPGGGMSALQTFTVNNPAPTLTALGVTSANRLQTLDVVFTGTGFIQGVSTVNVGAGITVNATTVNGPTQLTANLTVAATAATGARTFSVTNATPGGGTSATQAFSINNPAPTLTAIAPTSGNRLATLNVVFTGSGFIQGTSTVSVGTGITVNTTTVDSPTQITANITIGSGAALGDRTVTVSNAAPGGGPSATQTFTVNNPAQTLTGIAPTTGARLQTLDVVFTGTGFITGASSVDVGPGITVNTTTVNSTTQITANLAIGPTAATGARDFTVTNTPGGTSAAQQFTVTNPLPTFTGIAPASGDRLQNLNVVLSGSGFIAGVTTVNVGAGVTVNNITVNSAASLTANITIAGTAPLGAQNFTVSNPAPGGGTSVASQVFTVANNPPPTLTGIAPTSGVRLQTLDVVFTGSNFISGVTTVDPGDGITVNSVAVTSANQLTANITIAATAPIGAGGFTVVNAGPGGGVSGARTFTVSGNPVPTLSAIAPTTGSRLQTLNVDLTGTGFIQGQTTANFGANITVNSTTVTSPTQATANITIAATAATGAHTLFVTNAAPGGGTSATQALTVNNPTATLTSIAPTTASRLQTLDVVFTGSGFITGVSSVNVGAGITLNTTTVNSPTQLTANITVTAGAASGAQLLSVTNAAPGGGTSVTQTLSVDNPAPTLTTIAPTSGARLQTLDVVFTGTGFVTNASTVDVGTGITVNTTTVNSPTQITANLTIGSAAATGPRNFTVTNPAPGGGTTAAQSFTVNNPTPTLASLGTTAGARLQTLDVVFNGTGFIAGTTTVNVGADITVNTVTVTSTTQLTANISVAATAALGARNFSVTNAAPGGGTSAAQSFTISNPVQTLTGIAPANGNRLQTLDVVFTGTGYIAGVSSVDVGAGITVNTTTVNSSTQITANITIGSAAATGPRNFTVTNTPGGTTAPQTFTVNNPAPTLTALGTTSGDRLQTLDVVFTGTGFVTGASTVNVGAGITVNAITVNSATQITANITITGTAALGARAFSVTNAAPGGGTSATQTFTVVNNPAPTLTALGTTSGNRLQTLDVVFTGSGFIQGVSTVNVGTGIAVNTTTVNSSTQLTANITIGAAAASGAQAFSVTNAAPGGGTSLPQTFTVNNPAPTLATVAPNTADRLQTLNVVFTGTGFIAGVSTVSVGAGITVNSTTVDSPTQITANITITGAAALGPRSFSVSNAAPGGGTSTAQTFTVANNPAPTLTALGTVSGNRLQTLDVVFTGTGFISGVSSIGVGADITVNTTTVNTTTQITANLTIGATAATGPRSFSVTNAAPGGGTSAPQSFTVNNPAPTLATVAPNTAERLQTLDVVFTGTGFINGVSTVNVGPDITVNTTTVNSATQITANVTVGAAAAIGARTFTVTNAAPGGGTSATQSFTVSGNPAPTLTARSPAGGNRLQTLDVTLTGTGFIAGVSTASVTGNDITVNSTTVNSQTEIVANITIAATANTTSRNLSVTNAAPGGGTSGVLAFAVSNPLPTLTALGTTAGDRLQTLNVVFTGTGFISGETSVNVGGADITVNTTTVNSPTQLTANLTISPTAATGPRSFSVTNAAPGGGTSASQTFTVNNPTPTLASLGTTAGARLQTLDVVFNGTGFIAGTTTVNVGADITVNTVTVTSTTQLTANITITEAAALGARSFTVVNAAPGGGTSAGQTFTVGNPAPTLTGVAPATGTQGQADLEVVLTGTNFIGGTTTFDFGADIAVNTVTVNSPTQATVKITIGAAAVTGARDVTATNTPTGGSSTLAASFTVTP